MDTDMEVQEVEKRDAAIQAAPRLKDRGGAKAARSTPPETAAVTITVPGGRGTSYAGVLRAAKEMSLEVLGIDGINCRSAVTGGLVLKVPGEGSSEKTDTLARQVSAALEGSGVRAARPTKCVELRLRSLDDSVTQGEIAAAIAAVGSCLEGDVRVGEILRPPKGMGIVWARCPTGAASEAELLQTRPLRCYRCLDMGHVWALCTSLVDRSGLCYRCGVSGHRASLCPAAAPKCPLCADLGLPVGHRLEGAGCPCPKSNGKMGNQAPRRGEKPASPEVASGEGMVWESSGSRPPRSPS
ncbi:hypothetical protein DBV15_12725 [Temnothorax longispinosus]|uniref:CCHC-type domain-containing protein n=1 Tax=Temnothorax longispinosus TaxID=300112 RepID=A0A4S2KWS1_9HYME|nr:hypothetical protein DBV15_12725 [Temnothorax longispinosus]